MARRSRSSRRTSALRVVVALMLAVTGCGDGGSGGAQVAESPDGASEPGNVACGKDFRMPPAGSLRLDGRFPSSVSAGQDAVNGTVEVSSDRPVSQLAAAAADAFLVRDGKVVTMPPPQDAMAVRFDLAGGETKSVPAFGSLVSCESAGVRVPPGDYELYARFMLIPEDGEPAPSFGGPWPLTVSQ